MAIKHELSSGELNWTEKQAALKNTNILHSQQQQQQTTSADGPVLPVCSPSACDDGTKISPLSNPEIEVHKGGRGKVFEDTNMGDSGQFLCNRSKFEKLLSVLAFHPHQAAIFHTQ